MNPTGGLQKIIDELESKQALDVIISLKIMSHML
jgi:hypothetical protein